MREKSIQTDGPRREFLKAGLTGAAGVTAAFKAGHLRPAFAAGSDEIRIGLVGCGGRGTGAATNALKAAPGVKLVAIADLFKDRLDASLARLKGTPELADRIAVTPDTCFTGFDAYKKLLAIGDINYVILATPPGFRPLHLQAAVAANKNVFSEKPVAVDGPGVRICFEVADEAKKKGLAIGVGLQRHHQRGYLEIIPRIQQGAIGDIVAGRAWNQGLLWMKPRQKEWSDMEWQLRNWLYFTWLSGDHICEQHIHNIDVIQWGIGTHAVAALATGGRQVRTDPAYGHIFDHFAVDYEFPGDVHVQSMARQIAGCTNACSEHFQGTKGRVDFVNGSKKYAVDSKTKPFVYDATNEKEPEPYIKEHIDLIAAIRKGKPYSELRSCAESTLAAVMGRMSAYSGKRVTWDQALNSKESLMPSKLELGKLATPAVAIPGTTEII